MAKEKKQKFKYDFATTDLIIYVWQKRKPLAFISFAAFIISMITSLAITPRFRASVIMFPTTGTSVSKNLLSDSYSGGQSIYEIGEEEQAEYLLQVLNSDEIRDRIIQKYDLMKHYDIKPSAKFPKTKINAIYKSNIKFKRTPYMAVLVDVLDKDPETAANIANDISVFADSVYHRMIRQRATDAYKLVEKEYHSLLDSIKQMQDSIYKIRKIGINHYEAQSERFYEAYAKAIVENNKEAAGILSDKIKILSEYGGQYVYIRDQISYETARLIRIKQKLTESRLELEQNLPYTFIVNKAVIPEKKAFPKKSIIIIASVFAAFLAGLFSLIVKDNYQKKLI